MIRIISLGVIVFWLGIPRTGNSFPVEVHLAECTRLDQSVLSKSIELELSPIENPSESTAPYVIQIRCNDGAVVVHVFNPSLNRSVERIVKFDAADDGDANRIIAIVAAQLCRVLTNDVPTPDGPDDSVPTVEKPSVPPTEDHAETTATADSRAHLYLAAGAMFRALPNGIPAVHAAAGAGKRFGAPFVVRGVFTFEWAKKKFEEDAASMYAWLLAAQGCYAPRIHRRVGLFVGLAAAVGVGLVESHVRTPATDVDSIPDAAVRTVTHTAVGVTGDFSAQLGAEFYLKRFGIGILVVGGYMLERPSGASIGDAPSFLGGWYAGPRAHLTFGF